EVTLGLVVRLDPVTKGDQVVVGELVDPEVATDLRGLQGGEGAGAAHAEDVGEGNLESLVAREVNPDQTCHQAVLPFLWSMRALAPRIRGTRSGTPVPGIAEVSGVMRPGLPREALCLHLTSRGRPTWAS